MEKIIHFTVRDPDSLSPVQADAIDRARDLHPDWEIRIWRCPPVPMEGQGFLLSQYWNKVNSGAQFSDLLRLELLYKFGGVYVDSDERLYRPLDELIRHYECFLASEDGFDLSNGLIGACKGSPTIRYLIDQHIACEPNWGLAANITTGPKFFTRHLRWRKEVTVLPRESFYPYLGYVTEKKVHRHSLGDQLWAGSWLPVHARVTAPKKENPIQRVLSILSRTMKDRLRKGIVRVFHTWNRVKSLDPKQSHPSIKSYQCSGELVVQSIHNLAIIVDGCDVRRTPQLVFRGHYNLPEENLLKRHVRGGDWVIDVGANIGSFSVLAAHCVGPFGRVFSYEPNPRPAKLMAKSLVMNCVNERVIQRPVAVVDKAGYMELSSFTGRLRDDAVGQHVIANGNSEVACVRIDDEFPVDLPIKMLRIHAEGFEGRILLGARRLLRQRCIDLVAIELSEEATTRNWREIANQVNDAIGFGYSLCTISDGDTLVEEHSLDTAIRNRQLILVAQEQYRPAPPVATATQLRE